MATTASTPATAMRMSSNVLALSSRYFNAGPEYGSGSIFNSTSAIKPTAVRLTVGLPPGCSAKPPLVLSKQLLTNSTHVVLSGTSPPLYFNARKAEEVAPKVDFVCPSAGEKP